MNLYLIFMFFLCLIGIKIYFKDFNDNYLDKDITSCIKGIFILFVFYQHAKQYVHYDIFSIKNNIMHLLITNLGQLIVTMFLFYSGYGIYESIKKKKSRYVKNIPKKRFLITLINFDVAILCFVILNSVLKYDYPLMKIILSFTGWESIGNSNWYIFAILGLYLITYSAFTIFYDNDKKAIWTTVLLTLIFILFISSYRPGYYYNTILCYNFGLLYSYYKDSIKKYAFNNKRYIFLLILSILSFAILFKLREINYMYYEFHSIAFVILLNIVLMKVCIKNRLLKWFGDNLFYLYIFQRIPMIILTYFELNMHAYWFLLLSFIATLLIAFISKFIIEKLDVKIYKLLKI